MANLVIKKDGTKVSFDSEKIKRGVMAAASQAGLSEGQASDIAGKILSLVQTTFKDVEEVKASDIRDKILSELDSSNPQVAQAWRKYEESKNQ